MVFVCLINDVISKSALVEETMATFFILKFLAGVIFDNTPFHRNDISERLFFSVGNIATIFSTLCRLPSFLIEIKHCIKVLFVDHFLKHFLIV